MSPDLPPLLQEIAYEREAQAYLKSLPLEHFMESTSQATQRKITWDSLGLLHLRRPEVRVFNELLVQYPLRGRRKLGQVVPDNMVVLTTERLRAVTSYNVPLEPARPFWVFEYVSKTNRRKDYEESFRKYKRELKVPYYLVFYPEAGEWTLYRHNKRKYVTVRPNEHDRCAIPELDLEVGLLDGWIRFWYRGELLLLPEDLQRNNEDLQRDNLELRQRLEAAERELARRRPNGRSSPAP
ncbi:MAG: Uma2 family endonuclease [Planctomycetes bacterium]|nr:Uma2 family endonuclease [Planctomycetota bacterium]